MELTEHFTVEEMTRSTTAIRLGFDNKADGFVLESLKALCEKVLEPVKELFNGYSVYVSSGYRCERLNTAVGGSITSQHMRGQAADITIAGHTLKEAYAKIKASDIPYDQLIFEFGEWIHISYKLDGKKQNLIATKENGKTVYKAD